MRLQVTGEDSEGRPIVKSLSDSADKLWELKKLEYEQSKLTEEIGRLKERDVRPLVFRRIEITDKIAKLLEGE